MEGVHYHKRDKCWNANLQIGGVRTYLGSFKNRYGAMHMVIIKSEELGFYYKKAGWEYKNYLKWLKSQPKEVRLAEEKMRR
ncbi:hypothetical protein [Methanobrevibacter sp.]|uniref:hypothetical protein n=1 Tax=Methanobrevibacter sp. TaxID=66852 RepID=UPI002FD8F3A8